jgi:hypothetical protein
MTRLWSAGEQIQVTLVEDYPAAFAWRGETHQVQDVTDRWRVDADWWRGRIQRDYFTVITTTGWLAVLYRDESADTWHIQQGYD